MEKINILLEQRLCLRYDLKQMSNEKNKLSAIRAYHFSSISKLGAADSTVTSHKLTVHVIYISHYS